MITQKDYMANSKELHHAYFSQFVTHGTLSFVTSQIGLEKLKNCTDPYFNGVVQWEPGNKWLWDRSPMNRRLAIEAGENLSPSTHACVGKAAARILLENEKLAG